MYTVEEAIEQIGFGRFQLKMSAIICVLHVSVYSLNVKE